MTTKDKQIIRELAKKYMELACSEKQQKMTQRMRDTNDLKIVRPPVLLDEIPWEQMDIDGDLLCQCEEEEARAAEAVLRRNLFRWKYFKADTLFEPFWRVPVVIENSGIGVQKKMVDAEKSKQGERTTHSYEDVLEDESVLEKMHDPVLTLKPEATEKAMNYYTDLFGNAMPVKLTGYRYCYAMPWDRITAMRGVEPIMIDMYDRPEYLHKLIQKLVSAINAELDFMEANVKIEPDLADLHCTPGMISGLADSGLKATWYRGGAQSFGIVSPAMFKEFELDYIKPITERFAYTYYGCCEPLDNKIEVLKEIKNLRKLGVSPWANIEVCAEQIRGDYVYSRKPNPSHVAMRTDPAVIRRETEEAVKACIKYGCPSEFVLKDITTVSHKPENLIVWAQTVSDVLDQYYGEA